MKIIEETKFYSLFQTRIHVLDVFLQINWKAPIPIITINTLKGHIDLCFGIARVKISLLITKYCVCDPTLVV